MTDRTLLVLGTGALARAVCGALAVTSGPPLRIAVAGRDRARVAEVVYMVSASAAGAGRAVTATGHVAAGLTATALTEIVADCRPDGAVAIASLQSPWEARHAPSAWTGLLAAGGFALSLPLQAVLVRALHAALREAAPDAWLVNACYPDAVNPLLAALDAAPLCGIGNISTIAQSIQASLEPGQRAEPLRVLAHHWHLHEVPPGREPLAYLGERRLDGVTERLAAQRAFDRVELGRVAGAAAGRLLTALLTGLELRACVPAPSGLPGGYPVLVRDGRLTLDLPASVSAARAARLNQDWADEDGVRVHDGRAVFALAVRQALEPWLPDRADGFHAEELDEVVAELAALRDRLRMRPASQASGR
ncbi:MAG TPA: hypothetical protein VGG25_20160 [Streptosporangiaceae bacterium]|jgi:hypothetical protein